MALIFQDQILQDGTKKSIIKFTGIFDGSGQETANTKLQGRNLSGALSVDANNAVLVSQGGVPRTNYNYSIAKIVANVNIPGGYLNIKFDGGTPSTIFVGTGNFDSNPADQVAVIPNNAINPNGNVTFTTANAVAGGSYTVIMEIHKGPNSSNNATDYSMGQVAAPADFNFGRYAIKP